MQYYKNHSTNTDIGPFDFHYSVSGRAEVRVYDALGLEMQIIHSENHIANWHKELEILYCTDGEGVVICDGKDFEISKGELFVINSERTHIIKTDSQIKINCIVIDDAFLLANFLDVTKIEFCTQVKDAKARELFERISSLVIGRVDFSDSFQFEIRTALLDFLLHLYKHHVISYNKEELESVASLHCKKAIRYITKNYSEEISIDAIAKSCMINKAHLSRIFKKETGKTLIEFLNIIRCTRAKELISEGFSVEEAATKCAFNNISYFTRTYKKHIGALPSKTKKRLKNKSINNR